jgi:DMSO/TMAO reductase YedYZ molybdopterin-dependent catalytic subunit
VRLDEYGLRRDIMMRRILVSLAALASLAAAPSYAQEVRLSGPAGDDVVSAADLAAMPRQTLSLTAHGETHVYEGPTLASVLERLDAPFGQRLRGEALKTYVVVRAADGYVVVFSLAEIDPAMSPTAVILADETDGAPLSAEEGPLRLVVEGDVRPARSVRQVTAIELRTP